MWCHDTTLRTKFSNRHRDSQSSECASRLTFFILFLSLNLHMAPEVPEERILPHLEMAPETPIENLPAEDDPEDVISNNEVSSVSPSVNHHGSSISGAVFNFTNAIVGAGAIGLGGAMAVSGGLISILLIVFFGALTKISLDLVIRLSVETAQSDPSYEGLAYAGMGTAGRYLVMLCKLLYSLGCLVAYVVVIKDNFAPGLIHLIFGNDSPEEKAWFDQVLCQETSFTWILSSLDLDLVSLPVKGWLHRLLCQNTLFTWVVSVMFILPLCLLRDMTPLSSFSLISVASMVSIVGIVIYLYFERPDIGQPGVSFYKEWLQIRPGVLESLGTFVFTFVSQHTVHLVFTSLKPDLRTVSNWRIVSSWAITCATTVSLLVGVFVYMTFWEATKSDIFDIYPQIWMIDLAKLLLCTTMVLTFPLPFFTCRELLIILLIHPFCKPMDVVDDEMDEQLTQPLLSTDEGDQSTTDIESSRRIVDVMNPKTWLLEGDDRQLKLLGHIFLTLSLWLMCTSLAIAAPNLGDVLDLVGCASGTIIAFIVPALLSFRLEGYSHLALMILTVGGSVGIVGTYFSIKKLVIDLQS